MILKESNSLWVRVLKGIYFPRGEFLTTRKGGKTSWGWSSILSGRDILKRENMWKVGDDTTIWAFSDPWVHMKACFKMDPEPSYTVEQDLRVCEFMRPNKTWNEEMLRGTIAPTNAAHILQIPIPSYRPHDQMLWPHTDDGNATVKFAYQ